MTALIDYDVSSLDELEYTLPCILSDEGCQEPAVALYSKSHTLDGGCWGVETYMCAGHLALSLQRYSQWLASTTKCGVCFQDVTGTLGENTRIIRI